MAVKMIAYYYLDIKGVQHCNIARVENMCIVLIIQAQLYNRSGSVQLRIGNTIYGIRAGCITEVSYYVILLCTVHGNNIVKFAKHLIACSGLF